MNCQTYRLHSAHEISPRALRVFLSLSFFGSLELPGLVTPSTSMSIDNVPRADATENSRLSDKGTMMLCATFGRHFRQHFPSTCQENQKMLRRSRQRRNERRRSSKRSENKERGSQLVAITFSGVWEAPSLYAIPCYGFSLKVHQLSLFPSSPPFLLSTSIQCTVMFFKLTIQTNLIQVASCRANFVVRFAQSAFSEVTVPP